MYSINNNIKKSIERIVGLPIEEIQKLSLDEERIQVKKKTSKKLRFSNRNRKSIYGRGNPLLARKKYRTIEYIDNKIDDVVKGKY